MDETNNYSNYSAGSRAVWVIVVLILIVLSLGLGYYLGYQRLVPLSFLDGSSRVSKDLTAEENAAKQKFFGSSSPKAFSPAEQATMDKFFGN